ncbi:hypothetical protein J7297_01772 [Nakaseomyces glabratus]|nr:hypothetical protein J7297_01772 [Nakaseomyces glabratus]KAH7593234.1 hypothetical protein J7296_01774 [Nakaseomyces glabratus]
MIAKENANTVLECFKMNFMNANISSNKQKGYRKYSSSSRQRFLEFNNVLSPRIKSRAGVKKKTHVARFLSRQRKNKKPTPVEPEELEGPTLLRFGQLAGGRDERATRCPLRGIKHGLHINPDLHCSCGSFSIKPSPLQQSQKQTKEKDCSMAHMSKPSHIATKLYLI